MGKKVFRFNDDDDFDSASSTEFARLLLQASSDVRVHLSTTFGLGIRLNRNPILTEYDGRKVGFGSFALLDGEEIHFVIAPKTNTLRLQNLFRALAQYVDLQSVRFENVVSSAPAESQKDDFTFAFLLKLLEEIVASSTYLLNASYRKKEIIVRGGVKGRPVITKIMKNMALGRNTDLVCEVLDDEGLQDYAIVLRATAQSIDEFLKDWHDITAQKRLDSLGRLRFIASRFGKSGRGVFNRALLYKVCRPPFPYGLRNILYKCMRYWQWEGAFKISEKGEKFFGYWSVVIQLDTIFQTYVELAWTRSLAPEFISSSKKTFFYTVGQMDSTMPRLYKKKFTLDHLLIDQSRQTMLIIDAKYSENIATEDQIYQMAAYLTYHYDEYKDCQHRIGILVYPGDSWSVQQVSGFDRSIYCVRMPISGDLKCAEIASFVLQLRGLPAETADQQEAY